jgi:hypothetical protein
MNAAISRAASPGYQDQSLRVAQRHHHAVFWTFSRRLAEADRTQLGLFMQVWPDSSDVDH